VAESLERDAVAEMLADVVDHGFLVLG